MTELTQEERDAMDDSLATVISPLHLYTPIEESFYKLEADEMAALYGWWYVYKDRYIGNVMFRQKLDMLLRARYFEKLSGRDKSLAHASLDGGGLNTYRAITEYLQDKENAEDSIFLPELDDWIAFTVEFAVQYPKALINLQAHRYSQADVVVYRNSKYYVKYEDCKQQCQRPAHLHTNDVGQDFCSWAFDELFDELKGSDLERAKELHKEYYTFKSNEGTDAPNNKRGAY